MDRIPQFRGEALAFGLGPYRVKATFGVGISFCRGTTRIECPSHCHLHILIISPPQSKYSLLAIISLELELNILPVYSAGCSTVVAHSVRNWAVRRQRLGSTSCCISQSLLYAAEMSYTLADSQFACNPNMPKHRYFSFPHYAEIPRCSHHQTFQNGFTE
jgi:hypothetical protein